MLASLFVLNFKIQRYKRQHLIKNHLNWLREPGFIKNIKNTHDLRSESIRHQTLECYKSYDSIIIEEHGINFSIEDLKNKEICTCLYKNLAHRVVWPNPNIVTGSKLYYWLKV